MRCAVSGWESRDGFEAARRTRRRALTALIAVGALAIPSGASAQSPCAPGQAVSDCTFAPVLALFGGGKCTSDPPSDPSASTAAVRLEQLIEQVPCPGSGHVSFDTSDDHGDGMSALDVLANPAGGYLGVYHTATGPPQDALDYQVSLARSTDLLHWHRVAVLDPVGASMATLRAIPGKPGFVLAYEKAFSPGAGHVIRMRYYATLADLLAARFSIERDLPLRFSQYNNGTPAILSIRWPRSIRTSVIDLGFHYETSNRGVPGPDREALGTLRGFRRWSARQDIATDIALSQQGFAGSHGDWRQFTFQGAVWRLYEAQGSFNDFTSWRVLLSGPGISTMYRISLRSGTAAMSDSLGNPVASELPGPGGHGQVLVVTMFVFAASVRGQAGELVYYQPV